MRTTLEQFCRLVKPTRAQLKVRIQRSYCVCMAVDSAEQGMRQRVQIGSDVQAAVAELAGSTAALLWMPHMLAVSRSCSMAQPQKRPARYAPALCPTAPLAAPG